MGMGSSFFWKRPETLVVAGFFYMVKIYIFLVQILEKKG